jgi:uncharacterized protein (DUF2236 family)
MATTESATPTDFGLFTPDSVTWRIHADPSMLIGGIRALLIQALNPLAMAAVEQSTRFQMDPWGQLDRTVQYVLVTTFGDTASALAAGAKVQAVHRRVHGIDDVTGLEYRADDPELLLWVHCAEIDSFLTAYRQFGGNLTDADADRDVTEMVRAGELVGLDASAIPRTAAEVGAFITESKKVCVTPAAREGMKFLFAAPVPLYRRVIWRAAITAAVSILPRKIRELYGLTWIDQADPVVRGMVFSMCRALNVLVPRPPIVREALARAEREWPGAD